MNQIDGGNQFIKSERLSSKKQIDLLFQKGQSRWRNSLRVTWLVCTEKLEAPVQVFFSAPKKLYHKSVDRNLLKRRMREAYRLNKHDLINQVNSNNKYVLIGFIYVGKTIAGFSEIESDVKKLLAIILKSV
jgi:ribonuclease P protein component